MYGVLKKYMIEVWQVGEAVMGRSNASTMGQAVLIHLMPNQVVLGVVCDKDLAKQVKGK